MSVELDVAVDAVTSALAALSVAPRSTATATAVDRAAEAVDALEPHLTTEVLHRLVTSIEDCRREGVRHSPRLAICRRSTLLALRLDQRWTRQPAPQRQVS